MKRTVTYALVLVCGVSQAQSPEWMASRFGLNFNVPRPNVGKTMNDYANPVFREGKSTAIKNCHNDPGVMSKAGIQLAPTRRNFKDADNALWSDVLSITDKLPANTWLRVDANVNDHFYQPYQAQPEEIGRVTEGMVSRMMLRSASHRDSLNLLFVLAPGVWPNANPTDPWSSINVDPKGKPLAKPVVTPAPFKRDWWRPFPEHLPYLKESVQRFVNIVNDTAAQQSRARFGSAFTSFNFVQKIAFQLGNEPGASHPGGSQHAQVGSWEGLGRANEGTMAGINYSVSPAVRTQLGVPTSFGSNPLTMPAFSFLAEGGSQIVGNFVQNRMKNFQQSGGLSAAFHELTSYSKEMADLKWASPCTRRTLHFRSPVLRWKFFRNDFNETINPMHDLLYWGPGDVNWGKWETPEEYARRWVAELEKAVDGVAALPMSMKSNIVDVTETYFANGDLGVADHNGAFLDANGSNLTYQDKTLEQVREMGRTHRLKNGKFLPVLPQQIPPTRQALMLAVRNELYQRDVIQKNLSKNLGRIFLWTASHSDQRFETGLNQNDTGNIVGYNPWLDMRLSPTEIKAFWNIQ